MRFFFDGSSRWKPISNILGYLGGKVLLECVSGKAGAVAGRNVSHSFRVEDSGALLSSWGR